MVQLDRIKLITKPEYIKITNEDVGEWRDNRQKKTKSFVVNIKQPYNLFISITPTLNKAIIEFTGKILLDDYPKLISIETIYQCIQNINCLNFCILNAEEIIHDSDIVSCDVTKDIDFSTNSDIRKLLISQLNNLNKFHIQKYKTGYTAVKDVKTKKFQIRLSMYNKSKEVRKASNSHFLSSCTDQDALLNYFSTKFRIEANLKTLQQIRDYCQVSNTSIYEVLQSKENPLLKIFDTIFQRNTEEGDEVTKKINLFNFKTLSELNQKLLCEACDNDLSLIKKVLDNYLSPNTNKRKYIGEYRKRITSTYQPNENGIIMDQIRKQLIT